MRTPARPIAGVIFKRSRDETFTPLIYIYIVPARGRTFIIVFPVNGSVSIFHLPFRLAETISRFTV
jgi:hypothetical protein